MRKMSERKPPPPCPHGKPYLDLPSESEKCVVPCVCGHPCDDHQPSMKECWHRSGSVAPGACDCPCEGFQSAPTTEAST